MASFEDHAGIERKEIGVRWWDEAAISYRDAALVPEQHRERTPDVRLPDDLELGGDGGMSVFLGHYWLRGEPRVQNTRTAVLDYSAGADGPLVAYRWNGEPDLVNDALVAAG